MGELYIRYANDCTDNSQIFTRQIEFSKRKGPAVRGARSAPGRRKSELEAQAQLQNAGIMRAVQHKEATTSGSAVAAGLQVIAVLKPAPPEETLPLKASS